MKTLEYRDGALLILDQTQLPLHTAILECRDHSDVAEAIKSLSIRGAPAIGLAAAFGAALAARQYADEVESRVTFDRQLEAAIAVLSATRPTAVNLFWALERVRTIVRRYQNDEPTLLADALLAEAETMCREDETANRLMGILGADLIPDGANVLTHCNAGALATGACGTALGTVVAAHVAGKHVHVWVDETRPLLQGSRLTAWELQQAGIPFTVITDSMAGHFMSRGEVDLAVVGADRVAANGDVANKIGTYTVATLCRAHDIPLYVVAPTSTVDLSTATGAEIVIEERNPEEVGSFRSERVAPLDARIANPAFDITPHRLITAIVTEKGIIRPPFLDELARAVAGARSASFILDDAG